MSWRPKGWKELYHDSPFATKDLALLEEFEAGADAILEALKRESMPIDSIDTWNDVILMQIVIKVHYSTMVGKQIGWLIFIPDG